MLGNYKCILVLFPLLSLIVCDSNPIRRTANGPVEGIELTSLMGQKYYAFRSVPYAEAPITGKDPYTGEEVDRRFKVCCVKHFLRWFLSEA